MQQAPLVLACDPIEKATSSAVSVRPIVKGKTLSDTESVGETVLRDLPRFSNPRMYAALQINVDKWIIEIERNRGFPPVVCRVYWIDGSYFHDNAPA